ncbi:hypothetical protein [Paracidovorax citrulli]|uniref:hypothetical protein n=1 Tax=Paracidovorax citrulli TaxID=80869 RepID=UPI003FA75EB6
MSDLRSNASLDSGSGPATDLSHVASSVQRMLETDAVVRRRMRLATWVACASFVASAGLAVGAILVAPDASLGALDVPTEIATALAGPSDRAGELSAVVSTLGGTLVSVGRLLAVGMVVACGAKAYTRQSPEPLFVGFLFCMALLGAGAFYDSEDGSNRPKPAEKALFNRASAGDMTGIDQQFNSLGLSNTPAGRYVLAQAAAVASEGKRFGLLDVYAKNLGELFPAAKPQVLYAIDVAAFGGPTSEAAIDYAAQRGSSARTLQLSALAVAGVSALCLAIWGTLFGVSRSIRARIKRIHALVRIRAKERV